MTELPASPYLTRLETAIQTTRNPVEVACLRIERAGFLARQGFFEEAGSEIDLIRTKFGANPHPDVTVWLCIAESWMAHFSTLGSAAYDKMHRALALSSAMKLTRLQALSAAWLAHYDYVRYEMVSMAKHLAEAIRVARPDDHGAQARIGMVAALAYHSARREDLAKRWYSHARSHASGDSDSATLSALAYNMATICSTHAFQASVFGGDAISLARSALIGVKTSQAAVLLFGNISQDSFLPIIRAMLSSVVGDYSSAILLYENNLSAAGEQGVGYMHATHLADLAWCKLHVGDANGAYSDALMAADEISSSMYVDDRAVANGRLAQVFSKLGYESKGATHLAEANRDWSATLQVHDHVLLLMKSIFP